MSCDICHKSFSIIWRREIKCKRCQRPICTDCQKLQQVRDTFRTVCKICIQDYDQIKKIISEQLLAWNHNSQIVKKQWLKNSETIIKENINKENLNPNIIQDVKTTLKQSFNYSMKEFFSLLWQNTNDIEITIVCVINQFVERNPQIGYNQYLIKITIFLLCFCKDYICLKILEDLYTKIPKQYHPNYQITQEFVADHDQMQHDAIQDIKFRFKLQQEQIIGAKNFIETAMLHYKNQFFLNLQFQSAFYIFDKIISSNDSTEIDKYFTLLIKINIDNLTQSELVIARNTTIDTLQQYKTQLQKKRSSLYLSSERNENISQSIIRSKLEVSEFDINESTDRQQQQQQSPTLLQSQKQEIVHLTQELLNLEQQISNIKIENQQLEQMASKMINTATLFNEYEQSIIQLIDQSENILKMTME